MKRFFVLVLVFVLGAPMSAGTVAAQDNQALLVSGNTAFAPKLIAEIEADSGGNLVFSPYSNSQALAMVYAGARGATAEQMAATLSFGLPASELNEAFGDLNRNLIDPGYAFNIGDLRIANALWGEQTLSFDPAFTALIADAYGAGLQPADFKNAPEEAHEHQ